MGSWHRRGLVDGASHAEDSDDEVAVAMMVATALSKASDGGI